MKERPDCVFQALGCFSDYRSTTFTVIQACQGATGDYSLAKPFEASIIFVLGDGCGVDRDVNVLQTAGGNSVEFSRDGPFVGDRGRHRPANFCLDEVGLDSATFSARRANQLLICAA